MAVKELNTLELTMLKRLEFRVHVSAAEYLDMHKRLATKVNALSTR